MHLSPAAIDEEIPGLYPAKQKRSRRIRDDYIVAGIDMLNTMRLSDIRVHDLAEYCGASVGSFYTRFKDKEAYFTAMRATTIHACNAELQRRVSVERLYEMEPDEALDELVDLLVDFFTSNIRGVLRESLLRILDPNDPWAPMRDSAREIMRNYRKAMASQYPPLSQDEAKERLSFCFQIIAGTLQNELVNDYHVYTTKDNSLRIGLKDLVKRYMLLDSQE